MANKVAVQLLFGQNEEPFLEAAIRSVLWADYFTICNTSPQSENGKRNAEIAYSIEPNKMKFSELYPDDDGSFSFADARNLSLQLVDEDDYVLIVDSDDVHFPDFEALVRSAISQGIDSITAHFYHLMVYKNIYQYTAPREIVYKKYPSTAWAKGVHEQLITPRYWPVTLDYKYIHYGYIKPQNEVFKRWKFYSDLEGDYQHYQGQSPDHILDDRISVSKHVDIEHPPAAEKVLENYPTYEGKLRENYETVPLEKVGLILLTYNDEEYIENCLTSLYRTQRFPDFNVLVIDNGSTDSTLKLIKERLHPQDTIIQAGDYTSLAESLNAGLDFFRVRHDIQYIGWIHPDMEFRDPMWLYELWLALRTYQKVGKICAANSRDPLPSTLVPGQEQCYLIRKDVVNKVGLFDEGYKGIGGYEDWDYNRRILNHDDYKVMITPRSRVYHKGMGTRSKRDTTTEQIANAEHYRNKWNTSDPPV